MRQELDDKLCQTYPKLFIERHLSMQETCMCWGFTCGDGWYTLINTLCNNIQNHLDWKNRDGEVVAQVVVEQVKEKYGTLRFYYRGGDDVIHGMVSMAESMSAHICEECGKPGQSNSGGWISTRCEEHTRG